MATPAQIAEFQRYTDGVGGVRQSHTGVSNKAMTRAGLEKQKVMIEPGVYKVRTAALNVQYHGFDDAKEDIEFTYKVKLTVPEKWLDNATPVSTLKAFFMKSYRKKFPEAPLSKLSDEEVDMAVKDDSMFMFSKKVVPDSAIVKETFHDRQDVWAMGPADWQAMENELKMYRKTIVRALAHCHKSSTDSWEEIIPVTSSRQLAPTNSYVILTGWYKMQCCIVKPHMTIADLKCYLHEKNGARMPLECIDIGVRSGDDIRIVDDALTLEQVYVRAMAPGEPDFGTGPGTLVDIEKEEKEAAEKAEELRRAEEEIEANKDKRGLGAGDKTYFKRHETTSRVHADWDNEDSELKTYSIDDQVHLKGGEGESGDLIGPQMPMYLRTTHKPRESKYAHLTADGETTAYLTKEGDYAERPTIKSKDVEAARKEAEEAAARKMAQVTVEEVPEGEGDDTNNRVVDITDETEKETLSGLEPEAKAAKEPEERPAMPMPKPPTAAQAAAANKTTTVQAANPLMGKTLVLGVGKRIQDVKHKIWVATVHDPYSFRGPEDKAAGGGNKDSMDLQMNGAPKGWSAPPEGQAAVNSDANCSIM